VICLHTEVLELGVKITLVVQNYLANRSHAVLWHAALFLATLSLLIL